MSVSHVLRTGRWELPPQSPDSWRSGRTSLTLLVAAAAAVAVPLVVPVSHEGEHPVLSSVLCTAKGLLALASCWLLLVQTRITQDPRLRQLAGGFGVVAVLSVLRTVDPVLVGVPVDAEALDIAWLVVLPLVTGLVGWHARPAGLRAITGGRRGPLRAGLVGVLLVPLVALIRLVHRDTSGVGPGAWLELLVVGVPAVGLLTTSARGFFPQARRWRLLEAQVRQLRASSPLLPGLSVTPEDESGLPSREEVTGLVVAGDVQVALQPVVDLASGRVVGQEALARFGGRIPTDRWFRAASLHGCGCELELRTLGVALAQLPRLPDGQFLAVNVSPAALLERGVLDLLEDVDLSQVVVEVTEHEAVGDYARARRLLSGLRDRGARVAVDDVGAGFASLQHVLLLQPDVVKLDVSLVKDVHDNVRRQAVVRALVTFAAEVGAVVLAEGIEVGEQVTALVDVGVELGQGWHLGKPALVTPV